MTFGHSSSRTETICGNTVHQKKSLLLLPQMCNIAVVLRKPEKAPHARTLQVTTNMGSTRTSQLVITHRISASCSHTMQVTLWIFNISFHFTWATMNNKAPFETAPAVKTTANTMKPVISFKATDAFLMKSVQVNLCQKLSFCRTWGEHIVYKKFSECQKQFLYKTYSPQVWAWNFHVLSL